MAGVIDKSGAWERCDCEEERRAHALLENVSAADAGSRAYHALTHGLRRGLQMFRPRSRACLVAPTLRQNKAKGWATRVARSRSLRPWAPFGLSAFSRFHSSSRRCNSCLETVSTCERAALRAARPMGFTLDFIRKSHSMRKKTCLFCDKPAKSLEHVWPQWILARVKSRLPVRHAIGDYPVKMVATPEITVRSVCSHCNQGWMSNLENECAPIMSPMIDGADSVSLDALQQHTIALWATKTAMVLESTATASRPCRFLQQEREEVRSQAAIPSHTCVWIGRFDQSSLGAFGTHIGASLPEVPEICHGSATTFIVGHFVLQLAHINIPSPQYLGMNVNIGTKAVLPLHRLIISIIPPRASVRWPPALSFDMDALSIWHLHDRWRMGTRLN